MTLEEEHRLRRDDDWHGVRILGAKLSIAFVFIVPILAIAAVLMGHEVEGVGNLLLITAGAMTTLLTLAYQAAYKGKKNESNNDDPQLVADSDSGPGEPLLEDSKAPH